MKDNGMAMKKAAMDMLGKLASVDLSKAKRIDINIEMGEGQHQMPDGKMMDDSEMEEYDNEDEAQSGRCPDCGDKLVQKGNKMMCPSCGWSEKINPDKDVEGPEEYKKDTAKVRKQEYGM